MDKVLRCDCGFEVRVRDEAEFVALVQRHAGEAHGMELTREQVLVLALRAQLDEGAEGPRPGAATAGDA